MITQHIFLTAAQVRALDGWVADLNVKQQKVKVKQTTGDYQHLYARVQIQGKVHECHIAKTGRTVELDPSRTRA